MKKKDLKKLLLYSTIVGGLFFTNNLYARTALSFTCIDKDSSATTNFVDKVNGEDVNEFILPSYCFTGNGCTLNFDSNTLKNTIGKINFGSGEEYFFPKQGTGISLYALGGPSPVDEETYNLKYNLVEIAPSFENLGKAVLWMGKEENERRWLTFYSENYLGFAINNPEETPFPEMFLTQGMGFTGFENKKLQLFYGMKNLDFGIEQGKIVSNLKIKSGDSDVTLTKIGESQTIGSNITMNNEYRFSFKNLYKPTNEVVLEITYLKDYHTFESALSVSNQTEVDTVTVEKNLTFVRSAFNNDFIEFMDDFNVQYLAKAENYYCSSVIVGDDTCTKTDFNPYLQLIYYKNDKVIGTEQVRVHDFAILDPFDPENSVSMDDLEELNINRDYIIPITVHVANNANAKVREADKIAYYLTDGKIEASSETMPSLSFGIGAGLQIEKRAN